MRMRRILDALQARHASVWIPHKAVFKRKVIKYVLVSKCFACRSALDLMPTGGIH